MQFIFFSEIPCSTGLQEPHDFDYIELKYLSWGLWSFVLHCQGFSDTEIVIMQTKIIIMGPVSFISDGEGRRVPMILLHKLNFFMWASNHLHSFCIVRVAALRGPMILIMSGKNN